MRLKLIFYDTETTGLKPDQDKIIEIAAYDASNDKTFLSFINPGRSIPNESSSIHHITDDMVKDAPDFSTVGKQFAEFCSENAVLVAHNNDAFDKLFLEHEFKNANIPLPNWKYFDTLKWAKKYRFDLPRHSLQYLREIYQIPANQAHRALDDVIILHKVYKKMIDDLSIETIMELISAKSRILRMPFGKHQGQPLEKVPKSYVEWLTKNGVFDKSENKALKEEFLNLGIL